MDELDNMAQGKIWSGVDAKELGLVDELGGIHDAIDIAKSYAGIDENKNNDKCQSSRDVKIFFCF